MMALKNAPSRGRFVWFAEIKSKSGQKVSTTINIVEKGLIESAISDEIEIINVQGTVQRHHTVTSVGNLESRRWMPHQIWIKKTGR